jgi:two-component system sensor histidine kinase/response regulator
VYSPFVVEDAMLDLARTDARPEVAWDIFDTPSMDESDLLFGGRRQHRIQGAAADPRLLARRPLVFGGRTWLVEWTATAAFVRSQAVHETLIALATGTLITGLLIVLLVVSGRTQRRALALAEQMTRALEVSEKLFRSLTTSAPVGIFRSDNNGRCLFVNDRWSEITGAPRERALGNGWLDFVHPEDRERVAAEWTAAVEARREYTVEFRYRRPSGEDVWVLTRRVVTSDASGTMTGFIGTVMDITDRVHAQQKLLAAKESAEASNRAKSQFLAMMSHEIRTPMNGVLGMLRVHLESRLTAEQREQVKLALGSAEALMSLLNDILDLSKIESSQLRLEAVAFDPRQVVEEVLQLFRQRAEEKRLSLRADIAPELQAIWLRGDVSRLRQILLNLVGNALKFTDSGHVQVRMSLQVDDQRPRGRILSVAVIDSGIGISPEAAQQLFEPFVQAEISTNRRFGGTGLGLAICKRLCDAMGGSITLDSTPGVGSRFQVTLPFVVESGPVATAAPEAVPLLPRPTVNQARVLLVEDNAVNRQVAMHLCRKLGVNPDIATGGREALQRTREVNYDLVLMDCLMPDMDGYAVTRAIRTRAGVPQPVIVALTASAMSGDREQCLAAGMDDYVTNPLSLGALQAALDRWLPRQPSGGLLTATS